ncbi:hypothetical protein EH223_14935 [candidate division KSB1 bacterium]|nr:hypothetical protein [candidate division KSB1 bacterium]RQW01460.1 MAG: hypothetical protein EH223_14935 [candidate division KSB1 bacterium]
MNKLTLFLVLLVTPLELFAQTGNDNDEEILPGGIAREDVPLAVVWSLSLYSGFTNPFAPDPFVEFWRSGFNLTVDADILLRSDIILGFSIGYAHLKFNQQEFWARRGVESNAELGDDFNIPITSLLFSYRGMERYVLYKYTAAYEIGGGLYHLKNTEIDITYIDPYGSYVVSETNRLDFGLFAGLGLKYLVTNTFQLTVKGRFHHVFKPSQYHQFFDVLLGVTIL